MDDIKRLDDGKVQIHTLRLLLRGAKVGDGAYLNEAFSDMEVMRYWSEPPHKNQERTDEWISNMSKSNANGVTDFIICLKPGFVPIGKIGVWQDNEIGFLLSRTQWGKGFAQEAMRAILPYLFDDRGLNELTADIDPRNRASDGLLQKIGFVHTVFQEKSCEINGEWVDSQYLKLTKERYYARESQLTASKLPSV